MTAAPRMRYPQRAFLTVNFFLLTGLYGYIARDMLAALPLPGLMFLLAAMVGYVCLLLLLVAGASTLLRLLLGPRW